LAVLAALQRELVLAAAFLEMEQVSFRLPQGFRPPVSPVLAIRYELEPVFL